MKNLGMVAVIVDLYILYSVQPHLMAMPHTSSNLRLVIFQQNQKDLLEIHWRFGEVLIGWVLAINLET